jgi:hypothetical protein
MNGNSRTLAVTKDLASDFTFGSLLADPQRLAFSN